MLTVLIGAVLGHIGGAAIQEIPKKNKRDHDWQKQGAKFQKISAIALMVITLLICIVVVTNGGDATALREIHLYVAVMGIAVTLVGFMLGGIFSPFKKTQNISGVCLWIAFMLLDALKWVAASSIICAIFA